MADEPENSHYNSHAQKSGHHLLYYPPPDSPPIQQRAHNAEYDISVVNAIAEYAPLEPGEPGVAARLPAPCSVRASGHPLSVIRAAILGVPIPVASS